MNTIRFCHASSQVHSFASHTVSIHRPLTRFHSKRPNWNRTATCCARRPSSTTISSRHTRRDLLPCLRPRRPPLIAAPTRPRRASRSRRQSATSRPLTSTALAKSSCVARMTRSKLGRPQSCGVQRNSRCEEFHIQPPLNLIPPVALCFFLSSSDCDCNMFEQ